MIPFTLNRERRLWFSVLAVLVAIYATMGPGQMLAEALRERNLLRISFAIVLLMLGAIITVRWIKKRPGWREIGVALCITIVYLGMFARITSPEERTHLLEYSIVAVLIHQALLERRRNEHQIPVPALLAMVLTALLGWIDESIQSLLPNRVYDIRDVGFNALAGVMAIGASLVLVWGRKRLGQA